jgi:hypothetical protein
MSKQFKWQRRERKRAKVVKQKPPTRKQLQKFIQEQKKEKPDEDTVPTSR